MAATDFNIGKNATLVLIANGAILASATLTEFQFKQETIKIKSRPLNGRPIRKVLPDGWTGSFSYDRSSPVFDDYFAQTEDDFWNGANAPTVYIQQTINELDGSISQYRFEGVTLEFTDGGSFKSDAEIKQKVDFEASARRKVL
jgi:hypothetical protein